VESVRRWTTDPPGYVGIAKIAYEFRSPAFSNMKRLTVNLKIVANGKQCLAATILNVDKFTSMTSEDEAIAPHVTKGFLQHKTYGLDEGMAFEAFRRRLEEETRVEIGRFGVSMTFITSNDYYMMAMTCTLATQSPKRLRDPDVSHRHRRLCSRVVTEWQLLG
jgi:hypothetical protein